MVVHLLLLKCSMAGPFVNFADAMVIYNWVKCLLNTSKWITTDISLVARRLSWLSKQFFEAQNNFFFSKSFPAATEIKVKSLLAHLHNGRLVKKLKSNLSEFFCWLIILL